MSALPVDGLPGDATPALPTPSQTVGPFYRFGLDWFEPRDLVAPGSPGAITLSGRILDGAATVHTIPACKHARASPYPVGPAS